MKKGFIATTLIYSFFLIFCAVLLSYIGISSHNKNLLNKANENIRNDIAEKTVGSIDIGSYVALNLSTPIIDAKDIDWIVFNNNNGNTELVSSSIVFTNKNINYIKNTVQTFHNECLASVARLLTHEDLFTSIKNNATNVRILKNITNVDNADASISYALLNDNTIEKFTYKEPNNDTSSLNEYVNVLFSDSNISSYNEGDDINVRIVISIPANIKIMGGSGSSSNPFRISTDTCYEDLSLVNKIIGNGYDNKEDSYTTPGIEVSKDDEGLRTTQDDYGTSYYFRGEVENNYLIFANKCWRIVRITGNGSIKLVLYNNSGSDCHITGDYGYAIVNGATLTPYNTTANNNTHIGFMYNANGATYEQTHINTNDSTILQRLKSWYDASFTNEQKNKIADVIWCNDKSINTTLYNGTGTNITYYSGERRTYNPSTYAPTLICPSSNDSTKKLSKFTGVDRINGNGALNGYKVGLLTADEVVYAGFSGMGNTSEPASSYLLQSAGIPWWTMTPRYFENKAVIYVVNASGQLTSYYADEREKVALRPSIALNSYVYATGVGTVTDPYVVQ